MRTAKSSEPVARCAHVAGARKQAQLSTEMKRGNALRMGFIVANCPRRKGKQELPVAEVSYNYDAVDAPQATRRNALTDQKGRKAASILTPRRNCAPICIACRIKFPAADSLRRALVQSEANAPRHSNIRRFSVGSNQHAQRYRALRLPVSGFICVNRIRTNNARWWRNSARIPSFASALAAARSFAISHASVFPRADTGRRRGRKRTRVFS